MAVLYRQGTLARWTPVDIGRPYAKLACQVQISGGLDDDHRAFFCLRRLLILYWEIPKIARLVATPKPRQCVRVRSYGFTDESRCIVMVYVFVIHPTDLLLYQNKCSFNRHATTLPTGFCCYTSPLKIITDNFQDRFLLVILQTKPFWQNGQSEYLMAIGHTSHMRLITHQEYNKQKPWTHEVKTEYGLARVIYALCMWHFIHVYSLSHQRIHTDSMRTTIVSHR